MKIHCPNVFNNRPYIEAPCPVPWESNLVIDVQYSLDLSGVYGNVAVQRTHVIEKLLNGTRRDPLWVIKRFAESVELAWIAWDRHWGPGTSPQRL